MNGLYVERIGDELLLTMADETGEPFGTVSLPIPGGVMELLAAIHELTHETRTD